MKEMCLECSGSGKAECQHCGGSGRESHTTLLNEACQKCQGSGWETCHHCHGTGRVELNANTTAPGDFVRRYSPSSSEQ